MSGEGILALFCDFENIAIGVRDAKSAKFDIRLILERLLLKGSIVVKKAYCDWDRYKDFKSQMHAAAFELIEIPHLRQSGKNSADIRMVVDALDLCYTKAHIDTFVIISGDSDFSPLVSKLRENAKTVIGVGVRTSTSDLLISNCHEFIFYDDLIAATTHAPKVGAPKGRTRGTRGGRGRKTAGAPAPQAAPSAPPPHDAIALVLETAEALYGERGDRAKLWGSMVKQTLQRRRPDFNETSYGYRSFNDLLEEAATKGLLELARDDKSGGYIIQKIHRPA
jgi:uncharacterized protein (TIGR00288 family)